MKAHIHDEQQIGDSQARLDHHNKPERLDWFADQGLGAFIHLSCDVQLGGVISHNLINANASYCQRYFDELPQTFCPDKFDPRAWARFFRSIGMRYVILTNKHHNGFCMWHTDTTEFSIANTPYGRDMTRELIDACRAEDLAVGVYFSPDDFHVLWQQGKAIGREGDRGGRDNLLPRDNPELMHLAKQQISELLTRYGPIDMIFFDGDPTGLRELAWELQPDCVVTRGALQTPEQHLPEMENTTEPWEACFTLGRQWQYRGVHEAYKSARTLIEMLISVRARGGNLLLNFGPKADGSLPDQQEAIMREVGLWMFSNREAIYRVRPYRVDREGDVFYARANNRDTVFAYLTNIDWPSRPIWPEVEAIGETPARSEDGLHKSRARGLQWRLTEVRANDNTTIELMAQRDDLVMPAGIEHGISWQQTEDELIVTAWYAHRQYNDWYWDLPMVIAIHHPACS